MRIPVYDPRRWLVLAVGLLSGPVVDAQDTAMRCGNNLVDIGDSVYEVLEKCGEPVFTLQNMWIYDLGPGHFNRRITFDPDGTVLLIEVVAER